MVGSLFAQYLPDVSKMSETEKMLVFENNKKSPALGVVSSFLLPSTGHAYSGNWGKGLIFFGSSFICFYYSINNAFDYSSSPTKTTVELDWNYKSTLTFFLAMGFRTCEIIDAGKEVKKYNNKLYKSIFGQEPPSFSLKLQPTYQGANLTMSYAFN